MSSSRACTAIGHVNAPLRTLSASIRDALRTCGTVVDLLITRRYPVSLVHFVTERCNARCPHCFIDFAHPTSDTELSLDEIQRLARRTGPFLQNVNLTGGEPFLREDLPDIARAYLEHAGVRTVFISTNGYSTERIVLLAEELARQFPNRTLIVSVSIDDLPEAHDRTRQVAGLFERAVESYRRLQAMGPPVMAGINVTISEHNHAAMNALYEYLTGELGVRCITAGPVRTQGAYTLPSEYRRHIVRAWLDLHGRIEKDRAAGRLDGFDRKSSVGRLLNAKNRIVSRMLARSFETGDFILPCRSAALFGVVACDGRVFPCETLSRPLGSLRDADYDLMRIWRGDAAAATRKRIRRTRCRCRYECAWTFNVLGSWRCLPRLLRAAVGSRARPRTNAVSG